MTSSSRMEHPRASVVIPAHNEAAVIGRTLAALAAGVEPGELEVIVVCNGCTDETAATAASFPGTRVLDIPQPSKAAAVTAGNRAATAFPRVHLDADVVIAGGDVLALVDAVAGGTQAVGPQRLVPLGESSWPVRAYYRVWEALPQVHSGLFGRGVVALSAEGQRRVDALPRVMSDDLAFSEVFDTSERRVLEDATVVVLPPRNLEDLLRRRTRVVTGNAQASALGVRRPTAVTSPRTLVRIGLADPRVGLRIPVFVAVTLLARRRARRAVAAGDFHTWLRDESSRSQATRGGAFLV